MLLHLIQNPVLEGSERLSPRCGRFNPPGKRPGADWAGGCVDLGISLDGTENLTAPGFDPRTVQ